MELNVNNQIINYIKIENEDYISITDMLKSKDGSFFVTDWLKIETQLNFWEYGKNYIILILIMANSP